jgi:hypothetical protein
MGSFPRGHRNVRMASSGCLVNNSRKEAKMRRMKLALVLLLVVGVGLLGAVTPVVAGQKGTAPPKPDGRFRMITTSIAPNMGVTWGDGRFSFLNQDYRFTVEAPTMTDSDVLGRLAGQQVVVEGMVYNLKGVSDFAGTYTRVKPEVVRAMGGTGRNPVFQNEKGVVVSITRRGATDPSLQARLMGDSFTVTMRNF